MTIPELPDHERFEIIAGEPCFKTASAGWQEIKFLRDAKDVSFVSPEFESCVAIARCHFFDIAHSTPRNCVKNEVTIYDANNAEKQWKLYGESRK